MRSIAEGARAACGALGLTLLLLLAGAPTAAQEQPSVPALLERLQQIQGQLGPGAAPPSQGQPSRADELIRRVEVVRQQALADAAAGQQPALGEDEVRRLVQEGLGVDVLSVELVERDGEPVYALTVMNPPGNYNGALMVRTLLIDGATGGLLGEVPRAPRAADPDLAWSTRAAGPDGGGLEIRRRTHR